MHFCPRKFSRIANMLYYWKWKSLRTCFFKIVVKYTKHKYYSLGHFKVALSAVTMVYNHHHYFQNFFIIPKRNFEPIK